MEKDNKEEENRKRARLRLEEIMKMKEKMKNATSSYRSYTNTAEGCSPSSCVCDDF